ncbi:MAG: tripartite tricarboxylate transporter substrate-binding protein, partial [Solimonas sp.]
SAELINKSHGLGMTHISYKGSAPAITALISNEVQFYLVGAGLGAEHVKSGKIRALAVSSAVRLELLPDTPTFDEAGLHGVTARNWWGAAAPAGTPKVVLDRLNAAFRAALSAPAVRRRLAGLGVLGVANSREQMAKQLAQEADQWSKAVKELGVKVE